MLERNPYKEPLLPWVCIGAILTPIFYFFSKLILGSILFIFPEGFITVPDWLFWVLGGGCASAMCVYLFYKQLPH